jgi:hypothetical protein
MSEKKEEAGAQRNRRPSRPWSSTYLYSFDSGKEVPLKVGREGPGAHADTKRPKSAAGHLCLDVVQHGLQVGMAPQANLCKSDYSRDSSFSRRKLMTALETKPHLAGQGRSQCVPLVKLALVGSISHCIQLSVYRASSQASSGLAF